MGLEDIRNDSSKMNFVEQLAERKEEGIIDFFVNEYKNKDLYLELNEDDLENKKNLMIKFVEFIVNDWSLDKKERERFIEKNYDLIYSFFYISTISYAKKQQIALTAEKKEEIRKIIEKDSYLKTLSIPVVDFNKIEKTLADEETEIRKGENKIKYNIYYISSDGKKHSLKDSNGKLELYIHNNAIPDEKNCFFIFDRDQNVKTFIESLQSLVDELNSNQQLTNY